MTPSEFKRWFQGFCEGMALREGAAPSYDCWKRIQSAVEEMEDKPKSLPREATVAPVVKPYPNDAQQWAGGAQRAARNPSLAEQVGRNAPLDPDAILKADTKPIPMDELRRRAGEAARG